MLLPKSWWNRSPTPLSFPRFRIRIRALWHYKKIKEIFCPGHISLLLLEKVMDFGLGVHNHAPGDLAEERNRACVSQGWGTQQQQKADWCRHLNCTPRLMGQESPRRSELLRDPQLSLARALVVVLCARRSYGTFL